MEELLQKLEMHVRMISSMPFVTTGHATLQREWNASFHLHIKAQRERDVLWMTFFSHGVQQVINVN